MKSAVRLTPRQREVRSHLAGDAKHGLLYGGSRSGKTFLICDMIGIRAVGAPKSRHVIFRRYSTDVKQSVGGDTLPKALGLRFPGLAYKHNTVDGVLRLPNGSEIWLAGLDDKKRTDKILGNEYATLYFNEASQITYDAFLTAQTRLAQNVQTVEGKPLRLKSFVDLNPTTRAHWTYRLWQDGIDPADELPVDRSHYVWDQVNPLDNAANLPSDYIRSLETLPERQRKRFLLGEYVGDDDKALWRREMIRRVAPPWPVDFRRIVVSIDPAVSNTPGSDETGLIVVALGSDGNAYVLEDASGRYSPDEWARKAIALFEHHNADRIVAEVNQGGDMVEATIRARAADVPYEAVRATRGKVTRAEPIQALYELGKVFHAPGMTELEDQMCSFTVDFDAKEAGWSPDRVDALVWGVTALFDKLKARRAPVEAVHEPQLGGRSWMAG